MPRVAPDQTMAWIPASKLSTEIRRGMTGNTSEPAHHTASHWIEFSKLFKMIKSNLSFPYTIQKYCKTYWGRETGDLPGLLNLGQCHWASALKYEYKQYLIPHLRLSKRCVVPVPTLPFFAQVVETDCSRVLRQQRKATRLYQTLHKWQTDFMC